MHSFDMLPCGLRITSSSSRQRIAIDSHLQKRGTVTIQAPAKLVDILEDCSLCRCIHCSQQTVQMESQILENMSLTSTYDIASNSSRY